MTLVIGTPCFGGMVTVLIDGDLERTRRVLERVQVFTLAESLGGVESLLNHPASMTHASVSGTQLEVPADVLSAIGDAVGATTLELVDLS